MPAVNDVGEPGAREPHARFDGRELETERLVRVTEVGQPDGKPRASRLRDLPPNDRNRASSRPYVRPVELEVPRDGVICSFVLVVACRCESGPGSCQEAR